MPPPAKKPPPGKKKFRPPTEGTEEQRLSRARGALLGLAVGEALGIPNEFRNVPAPDFPTLCDGYLVDMRGGGKHELKPGQVTWGGQMATALANTMRKWRAYDLPEVAKAYRQWAPVAFDVPEHIAQVIGLLADGRPPETTGFRVWLENGQRVRDNAALVRTAPIGVFFSKNREERLRATFEDTKLTHFHPLCVVACATLNGVIAAALHTVKDVIEQADVLKVAEAELSLASATLAKDHPDWVQHVKDAGDWLREDLRAAQDKDPMLYGPELHLFFPEPRFIRVAFRLAFWELFHAPTFEAGLLDVVNRGGDSDSNAAVTGALLGAVHGELAIPEAWREKVLEAVGPMGGLLWTAYHPRFLLNLASVKPGEAPTDDE